MEELDKNLGSADMGVTTSIAQLRTLSHSVGITIFDRGRSQQATIDEARA